MQRDFGSVLDHEMFRGDSVLRPWQEFYNSDSYEHASGLPMLKLLRSDFSNWHVLEGYRFTREVRMAICRELRKLNDLAKLLIYLKTGLIPVGGRPVELSLKWPVR